MDLRNRNDTSKLGGHTAMNSSGLNWRFNKKN